MTDPLTPSLTQTVSVDGVALGWTAEQEREAIVAWLREYPSIIGLNEMAAWNTAAFIERRAHLGESKG